MTQKLKYININEFVDYGYLQEANRQFFHPLGLSLAVSKDANEENWKLYGIWDYRSTPEGICFSDDILDLDKCKRVEKQLREKANVRMKELGYIIQPVIAK